jgi:hypothetical protein
MPHDASMRLLNRSPFQKSPAWLLLFLGAFIALESSQGLRGQTATPTAPPAINAAAAAAPVDPTLQYGREQVDRVLQDRPQLQSVVTPGGAIDRWLVKAFAAPDLAYKLAWTNESTTPNVDTNAQSSAYPYGSDFSYIRVNGIYQSGATVGQQLTLEEILSGLVYELNNARNGEDEARFDRGAIFQTITRNDYIVAFARAEFGAFRGTADFYHTIWIPYCEDHDMTSSPKRWHDDYPGQTFENYLARYPRDFWYPWHFYGERYDYYAAMGGGKTLALAQGGDVGAQDKLATIYLYTRDFTDAVDWYLKAAKQGNVAAEKALNWIYSNGVGVVKDPDKGSDWCLRAAEQGDAEAQEEAGEKAFYKKAYKEAVDWSLEAAGQGNTTAEKTLAWIYSHGSGVPKDEAQAFAWIMKAAVQGDVQAEKSVGWYYENGVGVAADPVQAKFWYDKAQGHPSVSAPPSAAETRW